MNSQFNSLPTEVYHGTTSNNYLSLKSGIDVNIKGANPKPDFGQGFYTTTNYKQALTQANRKADKHNKFQYKLSQKKGKSPIIVQPTVLSYQVDVSKLKSISSNISDGSSHLIFSKPDDSWGEFILNNRKPGNTISKFHNRDQQYHYVYGPLADGFIFNVVHEYQEKKITWAEYMEKIAPFKNGIYYQDQLSIHTLAAANCLTLKEVRGSGNT